MLVSAHQLILLKTSRQIAYVTTELIRKCLKWYSSPKQHAGNKQVYNATVGYSDTKSIVYVYGMCPTLSVILSVSFLYMCVYVRNCCAWAIISLSTLCSNISRNIRCSFPQKLFFGAKILSSQKWIPCVYSLEHARTKVWKKSMSQISLRFNIFSWRCRRHCSH